MKIVHRSRALFVLPKSRNTLIHCFKIKNDIHMGSLGLYPSQAKLLYAVFLIFGSFT